MLNKQPCDFKAMLLPIIITSILWLGLVGLVLADTMPVSWTAPTERSDGAPLALEEIANYRVWVNGTALPDLVPGADTSTTLTLPPGDQTIYLTTVDTFGRESVPSNEKFVPGGAPNAPGQILIIVLP